MLHKKMQCRSVHAHNLGMDRSLGEEYIWLLHSSISTSCNLRNENVLLGRIMDKIDCASWAFFNERFAQIDKIGMQFCLIA
jgi:hypothetical protein